eukprot:gnl/TRDRNA2_/TRDRNA2_157949_c0_seq1.p1 gnl/TRDRNA2_/TRDRNA2_157949_c0~~gnl/TRDRNA2_/TRDRNA2_157949_c0_seq1.p1  ORF type:complete len:706 (-),score=128.55 gnl/TRDRNA2_/TRDRNA2_157949_c0_seq1:62-2179(-)
MRGELWVVVAGSKRGGIVAREGRCLKSAELPDVLVKGAVVEEQKVIGQRLCYRKVSGAGPGAGWVSLTQKGRALLVHFCADEDVKAQPARGDDGSMISPRRNRIDPLIPTSIFDYDDLEDAEALEEKIHVVHMQTEADDTAETLQMPMEAYKLADASNEDLGDASSSATLSTLTNPRDGVTCDTPLLHTSSQASDRCAQLSHVQAVLAGGGNGSHELTARNCLLGFAKLQSLDAGKVEEASSCETSAEESSSSSVGEEVGKVEDAQLFETSAEEWSAIGKAVSALLDKCSVPGLDLSGRLIGPEGAASLAAALERNNTVVSIDLKHNEIGAEGAEALAAAMQKNNTLTTLDVTSNDVGVQGAEAIAAVLQRNSTLTRLDLTTNNIGATGAEVVAQALQRNSTLVTLHLTNNRIGDQGAEAIAGALKRNVTLTTLDLAGNRIGLQGAERIAAAMRKNDTVSTLDLRVNNIGAAGAECIAAMLERNATLTTLNLACNLIGVEGAERMAVAIEKNCTLTTLSLSNNWRMNRVGDEVAERIAAALERNSTLTAVDLTDNSITDRGAERLAEALERNATMTTLSLRVGTLGSDVSDLDMQIYSQYVLFSEDVRKRISTALTKNSTNAPVLVLTIRCTLLQPDTISITCTTMAGRTLAALEIPRDENLLGLQAAITERLKLPGRCLWLVLPDGRLLQDSPSGTLVSELLQQ